LRWPSSCASTACNSAGVSSSMSAVCTTTNGFLPLMMSVYALGVGLCRTYRSGALMPRMSALGVCPAPVQQSCERALREPLRTKVEVGERTASIMRLCRPPICLSLTNKLVSMFSRYSASSAMGAVRVPPPRHLTVHSPPSPPPSFPRHALPTTLKRNAETCGTPRSKDGTHAPWRQSLTPQPGCSPNTRLASMATPGSAAKMTVFCLSSGCLRRGPRPHQCRVGERFVDVAIEGARTQQVGLLQACTEREWSGVLAEGGGLWTVGTAQGERAR
jgi:hypothetical protein